MGRITLLTLALLWWVPPPLAALLAPPLPAAVSQPSDSRKRLLRLIGRWNRLGPQTSLAELEKAEKLLRDLDHHWTEHPADRTQILHALLDFLGRCILIAQAPGGLGAGPEPFQLGSVSEEDLRLQARAILRRRLPGVRSLLTLGVLLGRQKGEPHPLPRRIAACEVLRGDYDPATTLALLSTTRAPTPDSTLPRTLLDAAVDALVGRDEEGVHLRLLDLLVRAENGEAELWMKPIEAHFRDNRLSMSQKRPVRALALHIGEATLDSAWRHASRGVSMAGGLPDDLAFPLLIGALETWSERKKSHLGSARRVLGEIAHELERRSGRNLGLQPMLWRHLWESYLRGEVRWHGEDTPGGDPRTVGGFFGLRPETGRLVFLLDRSGSMAASFGAERTHSRLQEAADQMTALLAFLGPEAQFNVITFGSTTQTWKKRGLAEASEKNMRAARNWVLQAGSAGSTHLAGGVQRAFGLGRDGTLEVEELEADTIVVLCDGGTAEGPGWVEPFLRRVNDSARMVFHTVQLGPGGDGTLEALSAQTGGRFQRVED